MLKKRGNMYYVELNIPGRPRRSTGTGDYNEALSLMPGMIANMLGEQAERTTGSLTLREGFQRLTYEEWRHTRNASNVKRQCAEIEQLLGPDTPLKSIDRTAMLRLQQTLAELPGRGAATATPATVNRKLSTLIRLLNVAHSDWQVIDRPPKIRPMKSAESIVRALSDAEVQELLQKSRPLYTPVFQFLIETGARIGEFLALQWEHFDLDDQRLTLNPYMEMHLKSNKGRVIPLTLATAQALQKERKNGADKPFEGISRWMIRTEWNRVKKLMKKQHDRGFVPHALRHTCATRLIKAGVPTSTVQKWLGHADISTTTIYLDQAVEDMAVHVEAIAVQPERRLRSVK